MTNPNDTLKTLWEMSEQGTKEWWPVSVDKVRDENHIRVTGYRWWYTADHCGCCDLDDQHALDLVAASCERWLVGKGLSSAHTDMGQNYYAYVAGGRKHIASLPEAIEYAMGQEHTTTERN